MSRFWCDNPRDHEWQAERDFERRGRPDEEMMRERYSDECSRAYAEKYDEVRRREEYRQEEREQEEAAQRRAEVCWIEEEREYQYEQERYEYEQQREQEEPPEPEVHPGTELGSLEKPNTPPAPA